ncbi:MAG: response regulator [Oceanospirillaceae bacterium]|nr:response regulator [Oceanospirillaceae bacterium]
MNDFEHVLPEIITSLKSTCGHEFFDRLTLELGKHIGADYTFIARLNKEKNTSRTISLVAKGKLIENFEYSLNDTPCADINAESLCIYPEGICELYPDDQLLIDMNIEGYVGIPLCDPQGDMIGIMVALHEKKIENPDFTVTLFELFSRRISTEIERTERDQELHDLTKTLEVKVEERTQELKRLSEVLESALTHMPDGLLMLDEHLNIQVYNKQYQEFYSLPEDIITNAKTLYDILEFQRQRGDFGSDNSEQESHLQKFIQQIKSSNSFVRERIFPNGQRLEIRGNTTPNGKGKILVYSDVTERESARRQARLGIALENIPVAICLCDAEDIIVFCNRSYRDFYKMASKFFIPGASYNDLLKELIRTGGIVGDNQTTSQWLARRMDRRNTPYDKESYQLSDGRYVEVSDHILDDGNILFVGNDITKLREKELSNQQHVSKLQLSEERFKTLFHNSPVGVLLEDYSLVKNSIDKLRDQGITDFQSYFNEHVDHLIEVCSEIRAIYANKTFLEMHKFANLESYIEAEYSLGRARTSDWYIHYIIVLTNFANSLRVTSIDVADLTSENNPIELQINALIVPGHEEDWSEVITTHVDITYRKKIEFELQESLKESTLSLLQLQTAQNELKEAHGTLEQRVQERTLELHESQQLFKTILDTSPVAVGVSRLLDATIVYANPTCAKIFGYSSQGWGTKISYNVWANIEDRDAFVEIFEKDGHVHAKVAELKRKDGSKFWAEFTWDPVTFNNQECILFKIWDITDQKETELTLTKDKLIAEDASEAKSLFLANMSHEIRTPMNAVIGFSHLALMTELTPQQYDYISKIQDSSHNLLSIINDILDFSKIEAGKLEIEHIPFSIDDVLEYQCDLLRSKTDNGDIEVLLSYPWDLPKNLIGDPLRLGQILTNLASNAIKFTKSGEITLSASCLKQSESKVTLQFDVQDTGIGMTREETKKIFKPFVQADSSTTRKFGGSGLGLVICKQLVQLMDGEISVKSEKGTGSTFSFTCHFEIDQENTACTQSIAELKNKRVLIVDDNEASRIILSSLVQGFGMSTQTAKSGEDAYSLIVAQQGQDSDHFDLILMDWRMPGMDGLECAGRISDLKSSASLPAIIMVSAYEQSKVMKEVSSNNLEGYLLKPVQPTLLLNTIQKALGLKVDDDITVHHLPKRDDQALSQILGAKVLLVEDIETNQQVARELLEGHGLHVDIANNGLEAVQAVQINQYDIILMDIQMPEMDGHTATIEIRKLNLGYELPIIAMTANAMKEDYNKSLQVGMNGHINKPISPDELFDTLVLWIRPAFREIYDRHGTDSVPTLHTRLPKKLAGFDLQSALLRVNGNDGLLLKLMRDFYQDKKDTISTLIQLTEAMSYGDAAILIHGLIGSIGNLGANQLVIHARDLEILFKKNQYDAALFDLFAVEFEIVITSLASISIDEESANNSTSGTTDGPIDWDRAKSLSNILLKKLHSGDGNSMESLSELEKVLGESFPEHRTTLRKRVDDFEFDHAAIELQKLMDNLQKQD